MTRKLTLVILFFLCLFTKARAASGDSVTISIPPYTDTTCIGGQNMFTETDTFAGATVKWYTNGVYSGVALDTFFTTALNDGDSVYCWIYLSATDSARSNAITVRKVASYNARVLTSLTIGSNPDCEGHPLTFTAYPINGGSNPQYQWFINGIELTGEDSIAITRIFSGSDTVYCRMVTSFPSCSPIDTVYSVPVPIIHINLTAAVTIFAASDSVVSFGDTICQGFTDTFRAIASDFGTAVTYQWYVDSMAVPGAVNQTFLTDSLREGDSVYCVITTTDTCVLNPVTASNTIVMTILHVFGSMAHINLTAGSDPGCLDSPVTFTAIYDTFGFAPSFEWYVNGLPTAVLSDTITRIFQNNDIVSFTIRATDGGCYTNDTFEVLPRILIRDSTPNTPLVSLIATNLVTYSGVGTYRWYFNTVNSYAGSVIIPGATGPTFHPNTLGYYYVIKDSSNCPSLPSNIIYISLLKVNDLAMNDFKMYPNPTTGILSLDWEGKNVTMKLDIYNAAGQGLRHEEIINKSRFDADLSSLPDGIYYIHLRDEKGNHTTQKVTLSRE
ncbi:MAG: T9SS type A sorting domain-containing protein [Taibaiella sp.]|nr:T9SS type A sorting domain-containing protein [Taibaiella sp.]